MPKYFRKRTRIELLQHTTLRKAHYCKNVMVLQRGAELMIVGRAVWEERDANYGPKHNPFARQLVEAGWTSTDEDPRRYVQCRCWNGYDSVQCSCEHTF